MKWSLGFAAILLLSVITAAPFPFKVHKSGEDREASSHASGNLVKDTVSKAEAAARKAALERVKQGHKAESRIPADKEKHAKEQLEKLEHESKVASQLMSLDSGGIKEQNTKRVQEGSIFHARHHYPNKFHVKGHFGGPHHEMGVTRKLGLHHKEHGGLFDFGDVSSNNSPRGYSEDTGLEDRLAMEAEEEKKYETGENYGGWGGGGATGKSGISSWDLQSNIRKQDAAEKQSIQAQVASESAHELEEIQREIAQESQSSRGVTSVQGNGASVGPEAPGMKGMRKMEGMGGMVNPFLPQMPEFGRSEQKSYGGMMDENSEISRMMKQAEKLSPGEMTPPNIGNYGMGSPPDHGALDASRLAAAFAGQQGGMMGGQEMGQQGGFQEQTAAFQGGQEQGGQERPRFQGSEMQVGGQESMEEGAPGQGGMEQAMSQGGQFQGMGGMEQGGMEQSPFAGMAQPEMGGQGMGAAAMMPGMAMQGIPEGAAAFTGGQQESPFGGGELQRGGGGGMPDFGQQMMPQQGPYKKSTVPQRPDTESKTHYKKKNHHKKHKQQDVKKSEKSTKFHQQKVE